MCQQYYLIQSIFTYIWRPILKQAKQKSLLLLPGLENVEIMEESSGPYSDMVGWGGAFLFTFMWCLSDLLDISVTLKRTEA